MFSRELKKWHQNEMMKMPMHYVPKYNGLVNCGAQHFP